MHLTKLPLILAASSLIAAQAATTSPNAVCAAQKIIDQCITDMKFGLENCASSDWDCKCDASTALV
ncbi:hypothetical protein PENDEC_c002G03683 [Penicillium decumbens]|uniref:Extracellular membrane protein CFEM domain-containing protein n=1 Tax=Penicillium decumbens TaxID=69771 RepID=A0A1V6PLE0_PENDC|nr:hypothetical protein PENDEC_c002G03683 [Penicillium decumbens]